MFSPTRRALVRQHLVEKAQTDSQIMAAALVGSAAANREDAWSDIDLALRLSRGLTPADVIDSWTSTMYQHHQAVAHTDLWGGDTLYRVFLLADSLQVDLSLWIFEEFGQRGGEPFRLVFGEAADTSSSARPAQRSPDPLAGMAWLHALHARSSIARGRGLQAVYMLNGLRDQIISLRCLRAGLPPDQGRGVDNLPEPWKQRVAATLVRSIDSDDLRRSFAAMIELLKEEIERLDTSNPEALCPVLDELVMTADPLRG